MWMSRQMILEEFLHVRVLYPMKNSPPVQSPAALSSRSGIRKCNLPSPRLYLAFTYAYSARLAFTSGLLH